MRLSGPVDLLVCRTRGIVPCCPAPRTGAGARPPSQPGPWSIRTRPGPAVQQRKVLDPLLWPGTASIQSRPEVSQGCLPRLPAVLRRHWYALKCRACWGRRFPLTRLQAPGLPDCPCCRRRERCSTRSRSRRLQWSRTQGVDDDNYRRQASAYASLPEGELKYVCPLPCIVLYCLVQPAELPW